MRPRYGEYHAGPLAGKNWRASKAIASEVARLEAFAKRLPPASADWSRWFHDPATAYTAAERIAFTILGTDDGNEDRAEAEDFWAFVLFPEGELPSAEFVEGFVLGALAEFSAPVQQR